MTEMLGTHLDRGLLWTKYVYYTRYHNVCSILALKAATRVLARTNGNGYQISAEDFSPPSMVCQVGIRRNGSQDPTKLSRTMKMIATAASEYAIEIEAMKALCHGYYFFFNLRMNQREAEK